MSAEDAEDAIQLKKEETNYDSPSSSSSSSNGPPSYFKFAKYVSKHMLYVLVWIFVGIVIWFVSACAASNALIASSESEVEKVKMIYEPNGILSGLPDVTYNASLSGITKFLNAQKEKPGLLCNVSAYFAVVYSTMSEFNNMLITKVFGTLFNFLNEIILICLSPLLFVIAFITLMITSFCVMLVSCIANVGVLFGEKLGFLKNVCMTILTFWVTLFLLFVGPSITALTSILSPLAYGFIIESSNSSVKFTKTLHFISMMKLFIRSVPIFLSVVMTMILTRGSQLFFGTSAMIVPIAAFTIVMILSRIRRRQPAAATTTTTTTQSGGKGKGKGKVDFSHIRFV